MRIDIFGGGWSNLFDVIQAVWQAITETIGKPSVGDGFGGLTGPAAWAAGRFVQAA